ncbi:MAG: hypothetical protein H2042_12595 [Rhizobiales bacterium]|nr:hypothetical protein [Hyphomicrobiales bacterium]
MIRRMVLAGLSAAILGTSSIAALAAPCGPAVLSKVDGKVLVNRGVGFLDGKTGMPLAVGDHVMLRGGTAEILFVNGTGSALSGAKSMSITACSADASMLTNPALAQANSSTSSQYLFGQTMRMTDIGTTTTVTRPGLVAPTSGISGLSNASLLGIGAIGVAVAVPVGIAATTQNKNTQGTIISVQPFSP